MTEEENETSGWLFKKINKTELWLNQPVRKEREEANFNSKDEKGDITTDCTDVKKIRESYTYKADNFNEMNL